MAVPLFQARSKEQLLKYSPTGKVPVYLQGNLAIWDSLAIAVYNFTQNQKWSYCFKYS
ncbi:MAG: glutathione S-transferase N-terminal domain-containing protein [Cyanobacteria bacterium P01_A01_bin.83]